MADAAVFVTSVPVDLRMTINNNANELMYLELLNMPVTVRATTGLA